MEQNAEAVYLAVQINAHMVALAELFQPKTEIRQMLDGAFARCTEQMRFMIRNLEVKYEPLFERHKPDYSAAIFHMRVLQGLFYALAHTVDSMVTNLMLADKAMTVAMKFIIEYQAPKRK